MKKFFSLIAAVLFAGSMMADSYTIAFKDAGAGQGDSSTSLTSTTVADYVAEGADLVSAVAVSGKVYNGQDGYGLKFGNSSNPGSITLTLAAAVTPTSIVMNASPWSATEGAGLLQDSVYETKSTGAKGTFADFTYEYDGATEVTTIIVGTSTKRGYVKSITINLEGGEIIPPVEEGCNWDEIEFLGNGSGNEAYTNRFKVCAGDPAPTSIVNIQAPDWADEPGIYVTFPSAAFGAISLDEAQYAIDGAGMVLYVSAFLYDAETEVTVVCQDVTYTLTIKNANPETPVIEPINCAAVYNMAKNDVVDLLNPVTVTHVNGKNVWVKDETASMLLFLPANATFAAGDVLTGVAGTVDIYQTLVYEVKPSADQVAAIVATAGEAPAPEAVAEVAATDVNKYIVMENVAAEGTFAEGTASNLTINGVTVRNNFKNGYTFEAGKTYNVYGVVSAYQGNPQVYFISAEEVGGEVPPTPSINYYVAGSMNNWGPAEAYMLTPNNENLYQGEFTFAANDEFKVIGVEGETTTWYPDGMDNNFQITEAGDYKITFNPAGNVEGWYAGFYNVVKKEAPIVHQYEVAEAIAAGLTDDTEILVRGVITKMEFKGKNFAKYGSVNIYVADATDAEGEFEFYNCYSLNADTFRTSTPAYDPESTAWAQFREVVDGNGNAIHVGDTVIAFGKYKLYNSTHELNTGCYLVDIKHAPQQPGEEITIDIESEVQYVDYVAAQGWWQFIAENDEYEISISNVSTTQAAGTYTIDDLDADYTYVFIKADSTEVHFVDGEFTLTEGEDGSRTIEGVMTGDDGNIYNIKLVFRIPTAETTVNVEIPEWAIADASEYYGFTGYIFAGETADESIYVQLVIPGSNPLGTFTYDDCYVGATGIEVNGEYKPIYSMNVTINASDAQRAIVTADILCLNNTLYHVTTIIGEGIDNIDAAVKAIKSIVNGQVVIEKAGKTYNMNGAVVR